MKIKVVVFDWGDTVMKDFPAYQGPMFRWPRVELVDGIVDLLPALSRQFSICLASNAGDSDAEKMGLALERAGIRGYFQYLFTSNELGFRKPDSNFYQEIVRRLRVAPRDCLMIGNDYEKDVLPAKGIGMKTVYLTAEKLKEPRPAADKVIQSLRELITDISILSGE